MATRSTISIQDSTNKIFSIYVHWDGYLEGVGTTLLKFYNDKTKIMKLISNGNISSLDDTVETTQFYESVSSHDEKAKIFVNKIKWKKTFQEFNYLWKDGDWYEVSKKIPRKLTDLIGLENLI